MVEAMPTCVDGAFSERKRDETSKRLTRMALHLIRRRYGRELLNMCGGLGLDNPSVIYQIPGLVIANWECAHENLI